MTTFKLTFHHFVVLTLKSFVLSSYTLFLLSFLKLGKFHHNEPSAKKLASISSQNRSYSFFGSNFIPVGFETSDSCKQLSVSL